MKNLKTTMIAALLMLAAVGELVAQDKYEFASICYDFYYGGSKALSITTPSGYEKKKIDFGNQEKEPMNMTFFFAEITKLQDEGWEVMTITSAPHNTVDVTQTAFLKRKKK